jgi:hypothetical protein
MMRKSVLRTPYCATCKKAGEPESVYTGHFTKDAPGGKVICPTIRGFKCKECGEMGHIANEKYCPVLREYAVAEKRMNILRDRAERVLRNEKEKEKKLTVEKQEEFKRRVKVNPFAVAFENDDSTSDSDTDSSPCPVTATTAITTDLSSFGMSYKDILSKSSAADRASPPVVVHLSNFRVLSSSVGKKSNMTNWADDYSSDGDEE